MTKKKKQSILAIVITLAILIIDQIIKIEVKTNFTLHESYHITDWFQIAFIENKGMAFGMSVMPKVLLSTFRFIAICLLSWYIARVIRKGARTVYVTILSMILAGAAGNLIDCMFYGLIFTDSSPFYVSQFVEFGTGYAPFLEGKVVDMFYFPLIVSTFPDWLPIWGGQDFTFFSPVFNFADASISVGVFLLAVLCHKEIADMNSDDKDETEESKTEEPQTETPQTEESKTETPQTEEAKTETSES